MHHLNVRHSPSELKIINLVKRFQEQGSVTDRLIGLDLDKVSQYVRLKIQKICGAVLRTIQPH